MEYDFYPSSLVPQSSQLVLFVLYRSLEFQCFLLFCKMRRKVVATFLANVSPQQYPSPQLQVVRPSHFRLNHSATSVPDNLMNDLFWVYCTWKRFLACKTTQEAVCIICCVHYRASRNRLGKGSVPNSLVKPGNVSIVHTGFVEANHMCLNCQVLIHFEHHAVPCIPTHPVSCITTQLHPRQRSQYENQLST